MGMADLQHEFTRALESHLTEGGEAALHGAYELGRRTLAARLGVLDVATLLHEALLVACLRRSSDSVDVVRGAGDFALECLSPFEMAHRAVREANTALRGLNDHLEEQTRRISRELHDQAGQLLASVYLALDDLARDVAGDVGERLLAVKDLLDRIEAQLRRLSHELRPTILDDLGLVAALEFLGMGFSARHALEIRVHGHGVARLPVPIETVLYRIVQEALNNVAKHARAATVTIDVSLDARQVSCSVRDDGIGFDPEAPGAGDHGIGLMGIRERLNPLGGVLTIATAPGTGTELRVTIPLASVSSGHS
jgi:two-component system, NarL family, sensor histidine kinase UhpB